MDTLKYPLTKEPARSILNISPKNQKTFQSLINIYNTDIKNYNVQMDRINTLQTWIILIIAC